MQTRAEIMREIRKLHAKVDRLEVEIAELRSRPPVVYQPVWLTPPTTPGPVWDPYRFAPMAPSPTVDPNPPHWPKIICDVGAGAAGSRVNNTAAGQYPS